jgi:uncharacterized membrane protein YhdT
MSDPALASLRGKMFTFNPITLSNPTPQVFLKYAGIILPILLSAICIFIIGLIYRMKRSVR